MPLANQLLLPQERFNIRYRPVASQRVVCPECGQRTLRKHLALCRMCGAMGCPACIHKNGECCKCKRKEKTCPQKGTLFQTTL